MAKTETPAAIKAAWIGFAGTVLAAVIVIMGARLVSEEALAPRVVDISLAATDGVLSPTDSMHVVGTNSGNAAGLLREDATLSLNGTPYSVRLRPRPGRESRMTIRPEESFEYVIGDAPLSAMTPGSSANCVLSYSVRQLPDGEWQPQTMAAFSCQRRP